VFIKVLSNNNQSNHTHIGVSDEKVKDDFWGDFAINENTRKNTSTTSLKNNTQLPVPKQEVGDENQVKNEQSVGFVDGTQDSSGEVGNDVVKELKSAQANIHMKLLPGWKKISVSQVRAPIYNEHVFLSLQNEVANCSVAFVKDLPHYDKASQVPFQHVSFFKTGTNLFGAGRWSVLKRDYPEVTKFLYKRTPMKGEFIDVHFIPLASNAYDIILYATDRSIVSDKCASDFREMLSGATLYIPQMQLSHKSRGEIVVSRINNKLFNFEAHYLFKNENTGGVYLLPNASFNSAFIYKNNILFISEGARLQLNHNNALQVYNPFESSEPQTIITSKELNASLILSIFPSKEYLYILSANSGDDCVGYDKCQSSLYRLTLQDALSGNHYSLVTLTTNATARNILTVKQVEPFGDVVYLSDGTGDAGCATEDIYKFFIDRYGEEKMQHVGTYGGCVNYETGNADTGLKAITSTHDAIKRGLKEYPWASTIMVKDGKLHPGKDRRLRKLYSTGYFFFVNY